MAVNPIEALAAVLVIANVALLAVRSIWNYPFALVAVTIYAIVFARAHLYSDMLLQGFFLVVNLYGWVHWARGCAQAGTVIVERLSWAARGYWVLGCAAATLGWGLLMHRFTDAAYPWWDACVAICSVAAQMMLARRAIENWWLWIAVDLAAVPLYCAKQLWLTGALYLVLLVLSIRGLIGWQVARGRQERGVSA
nr:nicotinamide riboside transporter PnuC [Sphingomonas sp. CROZ-RG-20F-R02-07]